jgi:NAD(P)-dependent dehydrogenase (short-subunit alcohol dehydrogenase family)
MSASRPVALVTGASSGIGAASASLLAANGFTVVGTSRRPPDPEREDVGWIAMDVRDEASVGTAVRAVLDRHGRIDVLVCNAGFGIFGAIEDVGLDRARAQFETNVFGTLAPIRAVLPAMRAAGRGRIVVVGSLAGRAPIPFQAHYSMTKSAVDALVMALRMEVAPFGVQVSLIEPGDIKTAFNDATDWGGAPSAVYGTRQRACEEVIRESLDAAPGPDVIARAVLRAATARRPRVRYPAGPSSWLVPVARRLLPDRWAIAMIRKHFRV